MPNGRGRLPSTGLRRHRQPPSKHHRRQLDERRHRAEHLRGLSKEEFDFLNILNAVLVKLSRIFPPKSEIF